MELLMELIARILNNKTTNLGKLLAMWYVQP